MTSTSVAQALGSARALGLDLLDAQALLANCVGHPRSWLLAHDDVPLSVAQLDEFAGLATRRSNGEPLAYLIGTKEFHGLELEVDARVLVPRPETEHLVDWGLEILAGRASIWPTPTVVDLGTGSGAVALAIKTNCPAAQLTALDASPEALQVARANAARLGLDVTFLVSDWWRALKDQSFDLALCNPPYVATGDAHLRALRHEPGFALEAGERGLDAIRTVINGTPSHLNPGAWLLLEHGFDQAAATRQSLLQRGFADVATRPDLAGLDRCTGGRWPGA